MKECVAAVGTFDGVHLGHMAIIDKVNELAKEQGRESRIITFLNHPLSVVAPERVPGLILPHHVSIDILEDKVDRVSEMNFTPELAALTAEEFLKMIATRYNVKTLVMGHDNSFGSDRLGSREAYVEVGRRVGVDIVFVEAYTTKDGIPVSSSLVRKTLKEDVNSIVPLLPGLPILSGTVVKGKRNGHKIGFPTLNIDHTGQTPWQPGVYLCFWFDEDDKAWPALLNVGCNPTISDNNPTTYEVHVLGARLGECYGEEFDFEVLIRLRDEKKFDNISDLKNQIHSDIISLSSILINKEFHSALSYIFDNFHKDTLKYIAKSNIAFLKKIKKSK